MVEEHVINLVVRGARLARQSPWGGSSLLSQRSARHTGERCLSSSDAEVSLCLRYYHRANATKLLLLCQSFFWRIHFFELNKLFLLDSFLVYCLQTGFARACCVDCPAGWPECLEMSVSRESPIVRPSPVD